MSSPHQRYFDSWAKDYDRDLNDFGYTLPAQIGTLLPPLLPPAPHILDIGIGTGLISRAIQNAVPDVRIAGVDVSAKMLDQCRDVTDDLRLCDAGSQILPFAEAQFDAGVAAGLIEFIENPVWLLKQCARVLKNGGVLILAFETIESAPLYRPGIIRGVIKHTPECATVRRVHYAPMLRIYNKYLHNARYVAQMAGQMGLILQDRQEVVAYTRPGHGPVAHDILRFAKQ